jgi:hypothetical protein
MKPCLICNNSCPNEAASCSACGEGSFGASVEESASKPAGEAPKPRSPGGRGNRGKPAGEG